jgi:hypothetical protein
MSNKTSINLIICSKPIQWFNALNITYPENVKRYFILIGGFSEAEDFYSKIKAHDNNWSEVFLADSREHSCAIATKLSQEFTIERLYVDSDYGSVGRNYANLPSKEFYVIEEGFGPYVHMIDHSLKGKIKRMVFALLGMGRFLGGHRRTSGIYLHNPSYYKSVHTGYSKQLLKFDEPFYTALDNRNVLIDKISGNGEQYNNIRDKRVVFYITRYLINIDIIKYIEKEIDQFDKVIIKTHPRSHDFRIEDYAGNIPADKLVILKNSTLAEVIISKLAKQNELTVIHESSSSCLYVDERNVKVINMEEGFNKQFSSFKKMYLEHLR